MAAVVFVQRRRPAAVAINQNRKFPTLWIVGVQGWPGQRQDHAGRHEQGDMLQRNADFNFLTALMPLARPKILPFPRRKIDGARGIAAGGFR